MWLAILAFGIQFLGVKELSAPAGAKLLLGLSYLLLALCVLRNRRLRGFQIIAVGLVLNLLVIYSNGGFMPAEPEAVRSIGLADASTELVPGERFGAKNVLVERDDTRLYLLSDRIPTKWPRPLLYSVGDAVLVGGLVLTLGMVALGVMPRWRPRLGPQRRHGRAVRFRPTEPPGAATGPLRSSQGGHRPA